MAKLIKIDRNGSKHWRGRITCDRCGGTGVFYVGVNNGHLIPAHPFNGTCYKCNGAGTVEGKWIERTPEYQAELDAKREAKWQAERERILKEQAEREAREAEEQRKREEAEKARKAISQYVGNIGDKVVIDATYTFGTSWNSKYGTQYLYTFKDADGNVLVWKTSTIPAVYDKDGNDVVINEGDRLTIKGTIKAHNEYKEEKQTVLTRCRFTAGA